MDSIRAFISPTGTPTSTAPSPSAQKATRYDELIRHASDLVKNGPLAGLSHIQRLWNEIEWVKEEDQSQFGSDAETARDGTARITLYPSLLPQPGSQLHKAACRQLIREFGHLLFAKASERPRRRWLLKLCLPASSQIDAVQRKLSPEFATYRSMVESFKTVMDRFVALNLGNALIFKGVPISQAQNVNLRQWGATQEYANRRRYHPIISVLSPYTSREILEDFGSALADWVCGTRGIIESSVAEAAHGIIYGILDSLR